MKNPFRKGYEITLNRVHDTVVIREGSEKLTLTVNGDAQRLVAGLTNAQKKMQTVMNEDATEEQMKETAEYFAAVIFGQEQGEKLSQFYANDPGSVISVCGKYFKERLADKIANVQKKMKI